MMKFEEKMVLAVEMANFRIDAETPPEKGNLRLQKESELPARGKQTADGYVECIRTMFQLIEDLEKEHGYK